MGSKLDRSEGAGFERAVEAAGHAIYLTDRNGTITYINPAFEEITGYTAEEAVGQTPAILNSGEHPDEYFERLWETILSGDVWQEEVVNCRKDGERYTARQTIAPITNDGEIDGFVAIQIDISEQKRLEERLRLYERAIEGTHDLICATDPNDRYLFANPGYREFHGIEHDDIADLTLADVFEGEEYREIKRNVDQTLQGEARRYRMTRKHSTQGARTFDISYYPLEEGDGEVRGVVTTMRDVTAPLERTRKLERNRALLTHTERLAEVGGWELELDTETLQWTDGTHWLHDVPDTYEPRIEDAIEFYHPDDREEVERAVNQCREHGVDYDIEVRLITADGRTRWVRTTGERVTGDGTRVLRGAIKDVTDRKQREQRLMVLNRVLRHNLRNNLTTVMGNAELLEEELTGLTELDTSGTDHQLKDSIRQLTEISDLSSELQSDLSEIERLVDQLASFPIETALIGTRQIKENSESLVKIAEKAQAVERSAIDDQIVEAIDITRILEEVASTYQEEFPDASIEILGDNASVHGNRAAIHRIVDELLENALKHSGRDSPTATLRVQMEGTDRVELRIADTGPGLPEMERQIIEEGKETPLMHGSGIGLWLVNWLVTRLGGAVAIEENDPRGTIVILEFPSAGIE